MSVPYPLRSGLHTAYSTTSDASGDAKHLHDELAALRLENEGLRQSLAATLSTASQEAPPPEAQTLPMQFDWAGTRWGSTRVSHDALLSALNRVFPIGIFCTDAAGLLTDVDSNMQRMFGLALPAFADFGWLATVHPEDRRRAQMQWLQYAAQPQSQSIELRLLHPDGQIRHVLARNSPMFNAAGQFEGQLGFVQDITEHRELEASASLKEELNRQIIASSPDCTKVLDLQGRVLQITAVGCQLMELEDFETVRNSDWRTWWPDGDAPLAQAALDAAVRGEMSRFVAHAPTFKGTPKWWDVAITPIRNAAGQPVMLLVVSRDISERHHQQQEIQALNESLEARVQRRTQELQEANQRIGQTLAETQALYNQAPCGYHSINGDGLFVRINQTELDWLGYQREEVIGRLHFFDLVLPEQVESMRQRLKQLMLGEALDQVEACLRRRDGSTLNALLTSTAVQGANGEYLHSNTTVVDISARVAAETALRSNERFIHAIADHVPGLIAYLDTDLRFRFANANHLPIYGIDPNAIIGKPLSECLSAEVWGEVAPRLQAALAGETQRFEAWRQTVQGQPIFISATYLPDLHEGEVKGLILEMIDITERKQIEERVNGLNTELERRIRERSIELLESEQRFRLMVDNMRDYSVFFLDADGYITDWTDSAQRMDGFSPTEMLGRHYRRLFERSQEKNAPEHADRMLELASSCGQHEVSDWHHRKDGSRYWAHSLLIALRDDNGELRGFAKINRDMTDAKQLDDLLRNINDELEKRVVERTGQLLAANQDLEAFSYSVSHDLRSPLRHVASFVSLLQEHLGDQCDEVTTRYLGTIGTSARHMSQLIDGLLAFSRLGRAAVNIAPVDFNLLVGAVVAQLAHDTEGRSVDWVVAPDLPVVQGDALLLREVWANLLGNAYKYTRQRERSRIEVGWSMDTVDGYTFYVRDNGVGFDTKYAQKLFGVFQRLHRASEFEGTGIGLALARRIVERHGGAICAESQLGVGSVFSFSLPFESLHAADSPHEQMN
jgi:PAS domain S-box-containing protein